MLRRFYFPVRYATQLFLRFLADEHTKRVLMVKRRASRHIEDLHV